LILPALLKILLLGLTMMASSAFAEDALLFDDNGRLPIGFKGDDAEKIYDTLANLPKMKKGQLETAAEYEVRLNKLDKKAVTFDNGKNLGSRLVMILMATHDLHDRYASEAHTMTVKDGGLFECNVFSYENTRIMLDGFLTSMQVQDLGDYTAKNAYSKQVTITQRKIVEVMVGESRPLGWNAGRVANIFDDAVALKPEPTQAQEAKGYTRMLVIGVLKSPFFYRGWKHHAPTVDEPWKTYTEVKALMVSIEEIWLYNEQSGEIYKKVKLSPRRLYFGARDFGGKQGAGRCQ
jgi:hypothetical protein